MVFFALIKLCGEFSVDIFVAYFSILTGSLSRFQISSADIDALKKLVAANDFIDIHMVA